MLKTVEIHNFQSHKKTELEFVPGVNVIIGESDSGKSAILRAMNWVINNRPLGDSFRSEWGGETKVVINTTDIHTIERIRSASKNEYLLDGSGLKAFGTEVPEEITEILQLDSYNIQSQMDVPFLLANTPGEAARMLNKAASIDDIDKTIGGLSTGLNRLNSDVKYKKNQIEEYQQELAQYDLLPEIEREISAVEDLDAQLQEYSKERATLESMSKRMTRILTELEETQYLVDISEEMETLEQTHQAYAEKLTENERICIIYQRIKFLQDNLDNTRHIENTLKLVETALKTEDQRKETTQKALGLIKLVQSIERVEREMKSLEKAISYTEKEYHELMPDTCPLCGANIERRKK